MTAKAPAHSQEPSTAAGRGRITGIDMARALAIIGMMVVHVGLHRGAGRETYALLFHGRASLLFILLAGVGVSLLAASRTTRLREGRFRLIWFALLLLPLGLWLQDLDHGVLVILQDYALFFLVGAAAMTLSSRWLLGLAGVALVLGPLTFLSGVLRAPRVYNRTAAYLDDTPAEVLHNLVLSGPYPLITWVAPFLFGMWLGRQDLRSGRLQGVMAVGGAAAAVLSQLAASALTERLGEEGELTGWYQILDAGAHSQMPLWLTGSTGSAVMVLGICLWLAPRLGRIAWPLVACGQLALTVYVAHLVALHFWRSDLVFPDPARTARSVLLMTVVGCAFAAAWLTVLRRGPLEALMRGSFLLLRQGWRAAWQDLTRRPGGEPKQQVKP